MNKDSFPKSPQKSHRGVEVPQLLRELQEMRLYIRGEIDGYRRSIEAARRELSALENHPDEYELDWEEMYERMGYSKKKYKEEKADLLNPERIQTIINGLENNLKILLSILTLLSEGKYNKALGYFEIQLSSLKADLKKRRYSVASLRESAKAEERALEKFISVLRERTGK